MKWLTLAFDIALAIYNHVTGKGKRDVTQELEIAKQTIKILTKNISPLDKGRAIEEAVGSLKAVKDFRKAFIKNLDKAKDRLWEKIL